MPLGKDGAAEGVDRRAAENAQCGKSAERERSGGGVHILLPVM